MHPAILEHVIPLVGKVNMPKFDSSKFGNILSLQTKIQKHINSRNTRKLKMYLAFCIQEWPKIDDCPVERKLIGEAINIII